MHELKRILVFGDTHIPTRATSIPTEFYSHIEATGYDMALITGDLVREHVMRQSLPPLPPTHIVQGNMDFGSGYDFQKSLHIGEFDILLLHGTQLSPRGNISELWEIAEHVGADIAVHGHTHAPSVDLQKGRLLLNPGTITGATGGRSGRKEASFIELVLDEVRVSVNLFTTDWTQVKTSVFGFTKTTAGIERTG
ncbi:YfcE family phosphodiesterase [Candidatus Thorarchaeota archaeon]|nr:MAG: YfcE family phosphodiesterase [Candidatus Thorarchaeota archaeon]